MAQLSALVLGKENEHWGSSGCGRVSVAGSLSKPLATRLGFCNALGDSGKQRCYKLLLLMIIIEQRLRIMEIIIMKIIIINRLCF